MKLISLLSGLLFSCSLYATIDVRPFSSLAQEQQYRELTEQLRCPKCQNNNIADSNAMIAADMRTKVYELLQQNKTKQQVIDYMVERYGYFVTYQPPLTGVVIMLWIAPVLFLLAGMAVIVRRTQTRTGRRKSFSQQEQQRLGMLLETDLSKTHEALHADARIMVQKNMPGNTPGKLSS